MRSILELQDLEKRVEQCLYIPQTSMMLQMPTILASRCMGHGRLSRRDFLAIMNHLHFDTSFALPLHKCSDQMDSRVLK